MLWPIYEWLWPLFAPCTSENSLVVRYDTPLRITDQWGNTLYDSGGYPMQMAAHVCPTATMDALLLLAGLCLLMGAVSLIWLLAGALSTPEPEPEPLDDVVAQVMAELDRASKEYLRNV